MTSVPSRPSNGAVNNPTRSSNGAVKDPSRLSNEAVSDPNRRGDGAVQPARPAHDWAGSDHSAGSDQQAGHHWPGSEAEQLPGHHCPGSEGRQPSEAEQSAWNGPLVYLITFTTYGTWLHGDARGSVDREHNIPGTPYLDPNARRAAWEDRRTRQAPFKLDATARGIVKTAVVEVCAYRGWTIHVVNVRTNHVHAVISAPVLPEAVLHDLKAYATRALRRAGCVGPKVTPWTAGGSERFLWDPAAVAAGCQYVDEGQGLDL